MALDKQVKVILEPTLGEWRKSFVRFCARLEERLAEPDGTPRGEIIEEFKDEITGINRLTKTDELDLLFVESVVLDLVSQDWQLSVDKSLVEIYSPRMDDDSTDAAKDRIRRGHLLGRDAQLKESSVAEFIKGMERRRLTSKGWHSIFSLMRHGSELTDRLRPLTETADEDERTAALADIVSPYIQFVDGDATCVHTGLRLGDIWRYFRHTWVNEYKSIPGRSMMILIRDAAAPNHPVIGIAGLGSSVVQHGVRDKWIGWHPESFVENLVKNPTARVARWLLSSVQGLVEGIYTEDLRRERIIKGSDIQHPTAPVIKHLLEESERAIKLHRQNPQKEIHNVAKADLTSGEYWERETLTHLFRSKRCKHLASLMSIRKSFQDCSLEAGTEEELREA